MSNPKYLISIQCPLFLTTKLGSGWLYFIFRSFINMKKIIPIFSFILATNLMAAGQDYKKGEFFAGFSHGQVDDSTGRFMADRDIRETGAAKFNGANFAAVYNVSRYVGIKADVSATYNGGDFSIPNGASTVSGTSRNSLYNFLGGVQFKDNSSDRRVKPFGHLLVGGAHARTEVDATCTPVCTTPFILPGGNETGFAGAFGGGVDVKLNDRFDLRVVQLDYNPVNLDSGMLHNMRIGVGIVIK
jgi:hypothetical protein